MYAGTHRKNVFGERTKCGWEGKKLDSTDAVIETAGVCVCERETANEKIFLILIDSRNGINFSHLSAQPTAERDKNRQVNEGLAISLSFFGAINLFILLALFVGVIEN